MSQTLPVREESSAGAVSDHHYSSGHENALTTLKVYGIKAVKV